MPYTIVDNFSAGLDSRRHVLNSKPGTLAKINNAHITRGGEIEKRKSFKKIHKVPVHDQVFGLESTSEGIFTFTHLPEGAVDDPVFFPPFPGLHYQRLMSPLTTDHMHYAWAVGRPKRIKNFDLPVMSTVFGGKVFAIFKYCGNSSDYIKDHCMAFYDGVPIGQWHHGLTDIDNTIFSMAQKMTSYFSEAATPGYTAEYYSGYPENSLGGFVVTGKPGVAFDLKHVEETKQYYSVTIEEIQKKVDFVPSTPARCEKTIVGGSEINAQLKKGSRYLQAYKLPGIRSIRVGASSATADDGTDLIGWTGTTGLLYNTYPASGVGSPSGELFFTLRKAINDNSQSGLNHKYKAEMASYGGWSGWDPADLWIKAPADFGPRANDDLVQIEFDSDPRLNNIGNLGDLIDVASVAVSPYDPSRFIATMGVLSGGVDNQITAVKVDGIDILGAPVSWEQSHSYTMNKVKTQIDLYASQVEYDLSISGPTITLIGKANTGAELNNKSVTFEVNGNVIVTGASGFSGGISQVAAMPQKTRVSYNQDFQLPICPMGKKFGVTITPSDNPTSPIVVGATRMADVFGKDPSFVFTYKSKVYVGFGSVVYFSALNDCTKWDIYDLGSGFIDMSNNFGGRDDLTGCGVYQDKMVFFTSRSCQTWYMDPDPSLNRQIQVIENSGCIAPESIISINSIDLIYLSDNGFRSLRSRENTDSAYANDIGSPIDEMVIKDLKTYSTILYTPTPAIPVGTEQYNQVYPTVESAIKQSARSVIDPIDGRIMIFYGPKVYVLSYFSGSSISAWSTYTFDGEDHPANWQIQAQDPSIAYGRNMGVTIFKDKVYVLSLNNSDTEWGMSYVLSMYGGEEGDSYNNCPVEVEMPYLDASKPATIKEAKGVDVTCEGLWKIYLGFDHTAPSVKDHIATVSEPTLAHGRVMATGYGTHFGPKFTCESNGKAKIANLIVHFDERHSKHEAG